MRYIELKIRIDDSKELTNNELSNFGEYLKDRIYDLDDSSILDVSYEILDEKGNEVAVDCDEQPLSEFIYNVAENDEQSKGKS